MFPLTTTSKAGIIMFVSQTVRLRSVFIYSRIWAGVLATRLVLIVIGTHGHYYIVSLSHSIAIL